RPLPRRSALRHHGCSGIAPEYQPMTHRLFVRLSLLPLAVVVVAFFLLPMLQLIITGASGDLGLIAYAAILFEPRCRATLIITVLLAAAHPIATPLIS